MSSYIGRYAELYDVFYADKPYEEEAAFVHQCLQKYGIGTTQSILELACGTGSHALALEKFGYQIVATDYSEDMLARARRKAAELGSSVDCQWQDMRTLDVAERPFEAVICLFDSIGYVKTNEAITRVLKEVHRHLCPDGLFIFEFWHAGAMLVGYEPVRVREWAMPEGKFIRISQTELDCAQQTATVQYSVYELRDDGTYDSFEETQVNRYFLIQEMAALLSSCDFTPLKWFSGFSDNEEIDENTWHVLAVARR